MGRNTNKQVVVIVGPTASGKSDLGIKIARKINGEIISADSRQVYLGMDVGTGKVRQDRTLPVPNSKFKNQKSKLLKNFYSEGIRHHLIDVTSPKKQFTASDFKRLGEKVIKKVLAKGKVPIIVGGTGFYIDILLGRMAVAQVPPNKKLRTKLEKQSAKQLFKMLEKLDPQRAETIDRHNKRRLIRALEIFMATKKSSLHTKYKIPDTEYNILWLGINPGKKKLAKNIKIRLDKRLKQGMIKEVEKLHKQGVNWKRLDNFGLEYRWISRYLRGLISRKEMKENLYHDIIKYSKRQITWFKRNKEIWWITDTKIAKQLARQFIARPLLNQTDR